MDAAEWLHGLGLSEYVAAFNSNAITMDLLPTLTADDIKDLGVTVIGHRRRLLNAITALRADKEPAAEPSDAEPSAERRQVTVMFCDISGSTALSTRLDPEDLSTVVRNYQAVARASIAGFGGFIARYVGDGVLIYFGWPEAHETDAERAVRAGLAVIARIRQTPIGGEQLSIRVGIATGLVVVGEPIGEGDARQQTAIGETPNLAARLQSLAAPNTLVIADSTRNEIGSLFEVEDLGPRDLAGFAAPQRAWGVLCESGATSRFEALRSEATPLIGRYEEMDLLLRRWQQAKSQEGRVVLLSGEPGIGKSRLTAAMAEHIGGDPHTRLRWFCSPHHQDSALYPVIAQLERAAGIARDDVSEARLGKLRRVVDVENDGDFGLLAELLSLPNSAAALNLSTPRKRGELFDVLLRQLAVLARQQPVLAVFEDVHWIDPTSRELLDLMIDRVRQLSVLLIVTFRPEFQPTWAGQAHVTALGLNRLDHRQVAALVEGLAGNQPLGSEVIDEIVERTDGVPLFVEELTKAVLERSHDEDRVGAVLSETAVTSLSVPPTLHSSLIARLDRIGPAAREIAQIGAVLGREFNYELIERVARRPELELQTALARLSEAELLFCRGLPPASSYLFKHALVQDTAYGTLLRSRRQELHARVATVLSQDFAELVERQPESLAQHLTAAGENERAVEQWLRAGRYAASRVAYREAIAHLERGLAALRSLPEGPARDKQKIGLQLALGLCLFTANGAAAGLPAYSRAQELAEQHGNSRQRFEAVFGVWQCHVVVGDISASRQFPDRLLWMTTSEADTGQRLQAYHSSWSSLFYLGELAEARRHTDAGRQLYDSEQHRDHRFVYGGHDPGVCARYIGAQAEWLLGYPDTALASVVEAFALADRLAHPFTSITALVFGFAVYLSDRRPDEVLRRLDMAEVLAAEQRLTFVIEPRILRGAALVEQGVVDEGTKLLRQGLSKTREKGATFFLPFGLGFLADGLNRRGEHTAALSAVQEGLEVAAATGQHAWDAELHHLGGVASLASNAIHESQAYFDQALRVARQQQAKSYELRTATSVARLWGEQGRRSEARELLEPIYAWFIEGLDTANLQEAKILLGELA
jgi:class 3 adenylate cyclase/predicted ATPase